MPRPLRDRCVEDLPGVEVFKPAGIPARELKSLALTLDEFESLRLADYEAKAATKDTTHTPTTSNRLRAAAMMPESAKAAVAAISSSRRRVWSQSEVGMERGVSEGVIVAHGMWAAPGLAKMPRSI